MPDARRGRPREFDTDAALEAAMQVFWKQGYEATSVGQLCDAMGIARQSMYDWVGDKRALFIASIDRYRQLWICGMRDMLSLEGSPLGNLRHCLHAMADYAKKPDCDGCLVTNTANEFGTGDEEIASLVGSIDEFIIDAFTQVLDRAKAEGEIPEGVDTRSTGAALAVLRNGMMVAGRSGQSHESIDRTLDLIEALLKMG
ncbi:MAG: TetR/AcrR family transcriptional regulator [Planctomycetota bacterium]